MLKALYKVLKVQQVQVYLHAIPMKAFGPRSRSDYANSDDAAIPTAFAGIIRKMNLSFIPVNPEDIFLIFPLAIDLSDGNRPQLLPLIQEPLGREGSGVLLYQRPTLLIDLPDFVAYDGTDAGSGLLEDGLPGDVFDQMDGESRSFVGVLVIFNGESDGQLNERFQHSISFTFGALDHSRRMACEAAFSSTAVTTGAALPFLKRVL